MNGAGAVHAACGSSLGTLPLALCLLGATSQCPLVPGSKERKVEFGSVFRLPAQGQRARWLETPWPSDVDVREDGTRIMDTFPNPTVADMLEAYRTEASQRFRLGPQWLARISSLKGPSRRTRCLPQMPPWAWTAQCSSLTWTQTAPEKGTRIPLRLSFQGAQTEFLRQHAGGLAGAGLPAASRHHLCALGVGRPASRRWRAGLPRGGFDGGACSLHVRGPFAEGPPAFAPLRDAASSVGVDLSRVVHATVFTTADPVPSCSARGTAWWKASRTQPATGSARETDSFRTFNVYEGEVDIPQFQAGTAPFDNYDGQSGGFVLDTSGTPLVQRTERVRFCP